MSYDKLDYSYDGWDRWPSAAEKLARSAGMSSTKLTELAEAIKASELAEAIKPLEMKQVSGRIPRPSRGEDALAWYPRDNRAERYEDVVGSTNYSTSYRYFNTQDFLAQFFLGAHFDYGKVSNWRRFCIGIPSYCYGVGKDDMHMPMLDYDGKNIRKQVRSDVQTLQDEFGLSDAWVYETRKGFHVYFFCDMLHLNEYLEALGATQACDGFKKATKRMNCAVLRISAKYTSFDIKLLYVLKAAKSTGRRMIQKAHLVRTILALGEECGTHFASLFPQWGRFQEDQKEWRPAPKGKGKRIRKNKGLFIEAKLGEPITAATAGLSYGQAVERGLTEAVSNYNNYNTVSTYSTYSNCITSWDEGSADPVLTFNGWKKRD